MPEVAKFTDNTYIIQVRKMKDCCRCLQQCLMTLMDKINH